MRNCQIISGSGDTDIVCGVLNDGETNEYKINVDAKKTGKSTQSLNSKRLTLHIKKNGSKYCIVISPKFAKGVKDDIKGDKIVIYGGGIIGLCALACLTCMGIEDVIVTARNPFRSAKIKEMNGTLCNTKEMPAPEFIMNHWGKLIGNNGEDTWNADIVVDCAGYPGSFNEIFKYAKCGSQIVIVSLGTSAETLVENDFCFKDISIHGSFAYTPEVNRIAIDYMTANQEVFTPIVTAKYGLSDISEAFRAATDHHKNIKVLIDHSK